MIFSPLSLALVLLMARFGARGNTAAELDKVLKFTTGANALDINELIPFRKGYFELLKSLKVKWSIESQALSSGGVQK